MDKFCPEQRKCTEDTDSTWSCLAHLAEGRVRQCPYKDYADSQNQQYPCVDARVGHEEALKPPPEPTYEQLQAENNEVRKLLKSDYYRLQSESRFTSWLLAMAEIKRLKKAIKFCREFWGEGSDLEGGIVHDCTGKSCVICNIEKILKGE